MLWVMEKLDIWGKTIDENKISWLCCQDLKDIKDLKAPEIKGKIGSSFS